MHVQQCLCNCRTTAEYLKHKGSISSCKWMAQEGIIGKNQVDIVEIVKTLTDMEMIPCNDIEEYSIRY